MLFVDASGDDSERGAAGEQLGRPEDGRQHGQHIEMDEVAVWHSPRRQIIDEASQR